jgi:hypothetical protein
MSTLQLHAHRRALIARARCPGCAEVLVGSSLYGGEPCSFCHTPTDLFGVSGIETAAAFKKKSWRHLIFLCGLVTLSYITLGWLPLLGGVALLVAGLWIKLGILYPITATFTPRRRIITRWSAKMLLSIFILATFVLCEMMTLTGVLSGFLKALIGCIQVGIAASLVTLYVTWQIGREQQQKPVAWWEWGVVGSATLSVFLCAAGAFLLLIGLVYALQWALDSTLPYLL